MIKLNDDSIYVGQVKQLLHSFNLPTVPTYREGDTFALGEHYMRDGAIYGHVNMYDDRGNKVGEDNSRFVCNYRFGQSIDGLTTRLPISSNIYDSRTHEYLGNYLRFIRDYMGMDLMGLYNCCGYDSPSNMEAVCKLDINGSEVDIPFSSSDPRYTLIMVPVRRGHMYTVAIDCHAGVEMACIHFDSNQDIQEDIHPTLGVPMMLQGTYMKARETRFNHPFIYDRIAGWGHDGDALESTLKLVLKVPSSCSSSIVVLEGDYRKCSNDNLYMDSNPDGSVNQYRQVLGDSPYLHMPEGEGQEATQNYDYVTKSQLLSMNLGQKTLLADRLVEYLSQQAIAPNDDVVDNIKRAQRTLRSRVPGYSIANYGMWDDGMRKAIYRYIWDTGLIHSHNDMLSYMDRDVESRMGGLSTKYAEKDSRVRVFTHGEAGGR